MHGKWEREAKQATAGIQEAGVAILDGEESFRFGAEVDSGEDQGADEGRRKQGGID